MSGTGTRVSPMLSRSEEEIPLGAGWRYEPKWDGFRAIVVRDAGGSIRIDSRGDRPLGRYFPELVELFGSAGEGTYAIDGEIVVVLRPGSEHGSAAALGSPVTSPTLDFDALQLRLHPAESRARRLAGEIPATFVAFDLVEVDGRDLHDLGGDERRAQLRSLVADRLGGSDPPEGPAALRPGPELVLTPRTDDPQTAGRWFADEGGFGQDGIVAKRFDQRYVEGERVMVKVKHHRTADCVVGGYRVETKGRGVGSLLLGLYDGDGVLHYVGHTSSFAAAQRERLREELAPLEGGGGFGRGRTPGGPSRWSAGRESEWVSLQPQLVCEVRFDRMQGVRFRHAARLLRWRPDRDPRSCTFDQVLPGAAT